MNTYLTSQNVWVIISAHTATVGLDCKSVRGDVVYIELPVIGLDVKKGEPCAKVESMKAISEVHAPVNGIISSVNDSVYDVPDIISQKDTWLFKMTFEGEADIGEWTIKK